MDTVGPTEPITDEATYEEHVYTPSYDPSQSSEDRMQLNELMDLCAKLSDRVLCPRENTNTLKRIESSDEASFGALEDASKQGRKIADFDADTEFNTATKSSIPVSDADPVTTAGEVVTTASVEILDELTLASKVARNLEAQLQAELEEEERLSRQKEEEANIALIESWGNTQAMMDADFQLA
ncbi:hypothetical protein Tco_1014057 [Tanacetum coccineum]